MIRNSIELAQLLSRSPKFNVWLRGRASILLLRVQFMCRVGVMGVIHAFSVKVPSPKKVETLMGLTRGMRARIIQSLPIHGEDSTAVSLQDVVDH